MSPNVTSEKKKSSKNILSQETETRITRMRNKKRRSRKMTSTSVHFQSVWCQHYLFPRIFTVFLLLPPCSRDTANTGSQHSMQECISFLGVCERLCVSLMNNQCLCLCFQVWSCQRVLAWLCVVCVSAREHMYVMDVVKKETKKKYRKRDGLSERWSKGLPELRKRWESGQRLKAEMEARNGGSNCQLDFCFLCFAADA